MTLQYHIDTGPGSGMGPSLLDRHFKFSTSTSLEIPTHRCPSAIFIPAIAVIYPKQPWKHRYVLANRRNIQKDESVTINTTGPKSMIHAH